MALTKSSLGRVGLAAMRTLSDQEVLADPAGAMKLAINAMRATMHAHAVVKKDGRPPV